MVKRVIKWVGIIGGLAGFFAWWRWRQIRIERPPAPRANSLLRSPDSKLSLHRVGDTLGIEWTKASQQATIYLGTSPDSINYEQAAAIAHNRQEILLTGIDPAQRYTVEVLFDDGSRLQQTERVLPLKSVPNLRDIGGYQTVNGQTVKWNTVYRASALDNLSEEDAIHLQSLGIKLICDVRTLREQEANPDVVIPEIEYMSVPPQSNDSVLLQLLRLLLQRGFLEGLLLDLYTRVMLENNPQVFKWIFERLADEDSLPMLIHCAAGKDRTGISIALLLKLLGVDDDTILADYSLSNQHYNFFKATTRKSMAQLRIFGLNDRDFDYLLIADSAIMQETLDYVDLHYASVEGYLKTHVGLSSDTITAIRQNLLE